MNYFKFLIMLTIPLLLLSCDDKKSYSELLDDEEKAVNSFLAHHTVITEVPADSIFISGPDAPYYKLDEDGNVYMQVIKPGDRINNKAEKGQQIFFRFGRVDLISYQTGADDTPMGNFDNLSYKSFKFDSYDLPSTFELGFGIQMPLQYLGIDCEVNLVIKSQFGVYNEISNVIPYWYHIKYYKNKV